MTCDLTDLKPVMQMSFGDWELFRTLLTMLRERENALATSGSSSLDSLPEAEEMDPPRNFQPIAQAADMVQVRKLWPWYMVVFDGIK